MAFHITIIELITLLLGMLAFAAMSGIAIKRWLKAYQIRILEDYSNPNAGYRAYYALYNSKLDSFVLMKSLLSLWPYKTMRYVNWGAYAYGRRTCDAIESYTGTPGDIDIIPIHHATPSRLGVENWLSQLRGNLVTLLSQPHTIELSRMKENENGEQVEEKYKKTWQLKLSDEDKQAIAKVVSLKWFGTANGFLPVENIGVLREDIRQAAKRFYAKSYDKERAGEGFLQRYGAVIAFGIMLMVVGLGMGLYWQLFFTNLTNFCGAGYCPNYHVASSNTVGSILPTPTSIANTIVHPAGS